ncbi:MAG: DUF790 family protein [Alphaproteobacteria bacterium]|nr:DUF790 family protein [Alphaproteobacteria bacterium]
MLTGDLVRVRTQKRDLLPSFVDPDKPALRERADELVALFAQGLEKAWTRGQLAEELAEIAGDRTDHKLIKGLAKVLEDNSEFEVECPLPPAELRQRLFEATGEAPSRARAAEAYAALAEELGLSVPDLKRALFADRKAEQQLVAFDVPDGEWLLHRYNVALVQALLFRCESLEVTLLEPSPERLQQLFRATKFHGLMYRITPAEGGLRLTLDGPTSLLRFSTRYGQGLSNWFPTLLLQTCAWSLHGVVRWTRRGLRKDLRLDSELGLRSHAKDQGAYITRAEQWFAERFEALDSGWEMTREGVVLNLGGRGVICPDYTFRKGGRVAHLEIVGFWRKQWLEKRLALLSSHGPGNLVLAVSSKMEGAKQGLGGFKGAVVPFKEIVPSKQVLEALEVIAIPDPEAA